MAKRVVRQYTVRDDVMLDAADRFHSQYEADEADFSAWNAVMFPPAFKSDFKDKIDAARAYIRDNVVVDEQVEETVEVGEKLKECGNYFQAMKPVIESTFPNKPAIWNQFGFNDYEKARRSQGKMILFMEMLYETSEKYKTELIANGFTQLKIDAIETLKEELRAEQIEQEVAKKQRPVKTQERVTLMNAVWVEMLKINKASKAVYQGNYAKLNEYELPAGSGGSVTPITGTVAAHSVVNILDMEFSEDTELRIKNTGTTALFFGLASTPEEQVTNMNFPPDDEKEVLASELGNIDFNYLNVFNDTEEEGSYSVLLLV
ncbi:MAG: hypothetical protein JW917_08845 [Ignavibacteria bacterium]|nr:hypothetical protein [Ignavibacteria bacterium]